METRIAAMQADNGKRLDEMRHTVDEKLQKTLDEKLQQSFSRVSEQLESVYKGLGEMQLFVAPPRPRRGGFCFFSPHPSAPQLIDKRKHFVHLLRLQGRVSAFKRLLHAAADMRF